MGHFLQPLPLLITSGLPGLGPRFPLAQPVFSGIPRAPSGIVPPVFPTFPAPPLGSVNGTGWTFSTFGYWVGSTGLQPSSIFSSQPSSSFINWADSAPFGDCFWPVFSRWSQEREGLLLLYTSEYLFWHWSRSRPTPLPPPLPLTPPDRPSWTGQLGALG